MKRFIRVLSCALSVGCVSLFHCDPDLRGVDVSVAHAAEPKLDASDCMSFQNDTQGKSILVHAHNVCEHKFSCSMSFVVRCEDNDGKATSNNRGTAHFALAAHGTADVPMSAEQCKQAWTIDDVSWVCR